MKTHEGLPSEVWRKLNEHRGEDLRGPPPSSSGGFEGVYKHAMLEIEKDRKLQGLPPVASWTLARRALLETTCDELVRESPEGKRRLIDAADALRVLDPLQWAWGVLDRILDDESFEVVEARKGRVVSEQQFEPECVLPPRVRDDLKVARSDLQRGMSELIKRSQLRGTKTRGGVSPALVRRAATRLKREFGLRDAAANRIVARASGLTPDRVNKLRKQQQDPAMGPRKRQAKEAAP